MRMNGFSLIEIMITSFILALGLLGLAGMQSTAIKSTIEIQQRTIANSLVADITERMQLNRVWLQETDNDYAIASLMNAALSPPSCVAADSSFTACSGEDIKNNDLYEWKKKFMGANVSSDSNRQHGLIEADACVEVDSAGLTLIVLSWYSTVNSKDAAAGQGGASLAAQCGEAGTSRRQLIVKTLAGKPL